MTGGGFVSAVIIDKKSEANDAPGNSERCRKVEGGNCCKPKEVEW